jgi:hypothetical protein
MLGAMDGATATGPLIGLAVAVLLLLGVGIAAVVLRPSRGPARRADAPPEAPPRRDDLPTFHACPPGSPGALPPPPPGAPVSLAAPPAPPAVPAPSRGLPSRRSGSPAWAILGLSAAVLLVIAAAAGVALGTRGAARGDARPAPAGRPPVPALSSVPASPSAGQGGAGRLAFVSVPLAPGDVAARMTFGGVVLERQAVGVTVTYPSLSLTASGSVGLAHVRLPTFNCLAADVPADPAAAGCVPSVTQYADLPTPALRMTHDGTRVELAGEFPTYVRPNGSAPVYTGRVYHLTVTATAGSRVGEGRFVAEGALSLGTQTARTDGDPTIDVLRRGR